MLNGRVQNRSDAEKNHPVARTSRRLERLPIQSPPSPLCRRYRSTQESPSSREKTAQANQPCSKQSPLTTASAPKVVIAAFVMTVQNTTTPPTRWSEHFASPSTSAPEEASSSVPKPSSTLLLISTDSTIRLNMTDSARQSFPHTVAKASTLALTARPSSPCSNTNSNATASSYSTNPKPPSPRSASSRSLSSSTTPFAATKMPNSSSPPTPLFCSAIPARRSSPSMTATSTRSTTKTLLPSRSSVAL